MTKLSLKVSAPGKDPGSDAPYKCQTLVLAAQQRLRCLDAFTDSSWVARTIREKDAAGLYLNFFSWGVRWDNDAATITCKAQDIPLDPKVNRDNCKRFRNSCLGSWFEFPN